MSWIAGANDHLTHLPDATRATIAQLSTFGILAPLTSESSLKSASVFENATGEALIVMDWSVSMSPAFMLCETATSKSVDVF